MKERDLINLLNRAAAALERYEAHADADAMQGRLNVLTAVELQELIEDLRAAATNLRG
jgi:hypothetical protein